MRKISADLVFTGSPDLIPNAIVIVNDDGVIQDMLPAGSAGEDVEQHKGIITPGFINTHCHLELSHMRGRIGQKNGMQGFVSEFLSLRPTLDPSLAAPSMEEAEREMIRNGIVAVGDISNDASTFTLKAEKSLFYHTFIEVFDIFPSRAKEVFEKGKELLAQAPQRASLAPHAPYTVSKELFDLIRSNSEKNGITSYHNQESLAESELYISKTGKIFDMFSRIGNKMEYFQPTGMNSLRSTLPLLSKDNRVLLVHNTFTTADDISWAEAGHDKLYWCFCPNANLYIEDALPDFNAFANANVKCAIGTDSLASNHTLSVLDELKVITKAAPQIPLATLLTWATKNGAEFLGCDELGTIEKGKRPGLNLVEGVEREKITTSSTVRKLI